MITKGEAGREKSFVTSSEVSKVTVAVIGLGRMGKAIAGAMVSAGHAVTVWNRTPGRDEEFREACSAETADSATEAIANCSLVIMCISDFAATQSVLESDGFAESLKGKTLVQLTSLTPEQARAQCAWTHDFGGQFIAGGIMCFPSALGRPEAVIFLGGDTSAYKLHSKTLSGLAGSLQFFNEDPGIAVAAYITAGLLGVATLGVFYETAALARNYGISIGAYYGLARFGMDLATHRLRDSAYRIAAQSYDDDDDCVDMVLAGAELYIQEFQRSGIPVPMLEGFVEQCAIASRAGRGHEDAACVADVLYSMRSDD